MDDHRLGLPVSRRTEFDDDWISMEVILGRQLGPKFDDNRIPMDDRRDELRCSILGFFF